MMESVKKPTHLPYNQQGPGASVWRNILGLIRRQDPYKDLGSILDLADPDAPLQERINWLSHLMAWLRGPKVPLAESKQASSIVRVKFLRQVLGRNPDWQARLSQVLRSVLFEADASQLFTRISLPEQSGLFSEIGRRFTDRFIPPAPHPNELSYIVEVLFTADEDPEWIAHLSTEDWAFLIRLVTDETPGSLESPNPIPKLMSALERSIQLLCVQIAALGLSPEFRNRSKRASASLEPFLELNRSAFTRKGDVDASQLLVDLHACSHALENIHASIEDQGVSLALLYRMEALSGFLRRLELVLLADLPTVAPEERESAIRALVVGILRSHRERASVSGLLGMNFDLFAKKLVEHAAETGEHYISRNRRDWVYMFLSGAGGGLVTVATTLIKFVVTGLHLPLAIEALGVCVNYAGSFLAMQFLGFSLATKQPSMTAASLAGKIQRIMTRTERDEFIEELIRITRSQFAAAVGNVSFVMMGSFIFGLAFHAGTGRHVLSESYAYKTLDGLNPFTGFTLFYAVITGVLLWLSSLGAGWLQNWVNLRALPEALRHQRRFVMIFGERRSLALGNWIQEHAAGIGGNVSIGFLLAFVPMLGKAFGLPLDIRHVTLSSGGMTFALMALGNAASDWRIWLAPALGLVGIGILNFWVSFFLALVVAIRSRRLPLLWLRPMLVEVWRRFRSHPLQFFVAPKETPES